MRTDHRLMLVVLAVEDVPRARRFYLDVFGWDIAVDLDVYVEFRLPGGPGDPGRHASTNVSIYKRDVYAGNTGEPALPTPAAGSTTSTELYLTVDDLDAVCERLRAAGARELAAPTVKPWGDTVAYWSDRDGNVLGVARTAN